MKRRIISIIIGIFIVATVAVFGNICKINVVEVSFSEEPQNVDAVEIFDEAGLKLGDSILSLNENVVKKNVMSAYEDNSIAITDIVRVFPNKVIIYCEEHIPMCAIPKKGQEGIYAIADGDFQLNKTLRKEEIDFSTLILVDGIVVEDTYNTVSFKTLHAVFKALEREGLDYSEQALLIEKLTYSQEEISILTRDGYTLKFSCITESIDENVINAYGEYISQKQL